MKCQYPRFLGFISQNQCKIEHFREKLPQECLGPVLVRFPFYEWDSRTARDSWERRGRGRDDYPIRPMWKAVIAGIVFQHPSAAALLRELRRNGELRQLCGFNPFGGEKSAPSDDAMERFLKLLVEYIAPAPPRSEERTSCESWRLSVSRKIGAHSSTAALPLHLTSTALDVTTVRNFRSLIAPVVRAA